MRACAVRDGASPPGYAPLVSSAADTPDGGTRRPSRRRRRTHEASAAEIRATARRVLAAHGPDGLSLSAVARELDVVPSALYRYVAGRDELVNSLLGDAYTELADAVERAESSTPDPVDAMVAASAAWRDWALRSPAEFTLVFGPPVPGHHTDAAVVEAATRIGTAFTRLVRAVRVPGKVWPGVAPPAGPFADELAGVARAYGGADDPELGAMFVAGWLRIQGHLIAEVFGQPPLTGPELSRNLFGLMLTGLLVEAGVDVDRAREATSALGHDQGRLDRAAQ